MFVVFYIVNLYICVSMTCSTFCCLHDKLTDLWNVCAYVYMYFPGPGCEAEHSHPPNAEVNEKSCTSISHVYLHGTCRNSFTFFFFF